MLNQKIMCVVAVFLLMNLANAVDVSISRSIPISAKLNENVQVTITVTNNLNEDINGVVRETITGADAIEPILVLPTFNQTTIAAFPPYFEWNLALASSGTTSFTYTIKPKQPGEYAFSPTQVILSDGRYYESDIATMQIVCNANGICEPNLRENYLTCSTDCKAWDKDNTCNPARDGHCDPDCAQNVDLDCLVGQNESAAPNSLLSIQIPFLNFGLPLVVVCGVGVLIILLLIAVFIIYKNRKKKDIRPQPEPVDDKNTNICKKCGAQLKVNARFCKKCGQKVKRKHQKGICAECGSKNELDAQFCEKCGAKL